MSKKKLSKLLALYLPYVVIGLVAVSYTHLTLPTN